MGRVPPYVGSVSRVWSTWRIILFLICIAQFCWSQNIFPEKTQANHLFKNTAGLTWQVLNINNLWTWHRSDGEGNHSPGGEDGMCYPAFTGRVIYEDNIIFGGIMYVGNWPESGGTKSPLQSVRVNGGTYLSNHGMVQGWVEGSGATANYTKSTNDPRARIYRIRRDYKQMTQEELRWDAAIVNELASPSEVTQALIDAMLEQYDKDWREWPVQFGAPYIDRNGNGVYDPPPSFSASFTVNDLIEGMYDEPGIGGSPNPADQVLYTVYHGLDRTKTLVFVGSEPMGIEIQKTVWGYKNIDDMYFTRYKFINKGGIEISSGVKGFFYIDSLFLSLWSDVDLGMPGDDLVGCDTTLHLGFVYNGYVNDIRYNNFQLPPPAAGYAYLQGLTNQSSSNTGMSSFVNRSAGDYPTWVCHEFWYDYDCGAGKYWKAIRGFYPMSSLVDPDIYFPHPPEFPDSRYVRSGDPVAQTGWLDGIGTTYSFSPGDRSFFVNTGPGRLAPLDTQEITVAIVAGIGADRLSSVGLMKANAREAHLLFENAFSIPRAPFSPSLKSVELDQAIVLEWGSAEDRLAKTEQDTAGDYVFQGYNTYQLPRRDALLSEGLKIATFDRIDTVTSILEYKFDPTIGQIVPRIVQQGSDSGIRRFIKVDRDHLQDGEILRNGSEYHFAVTAYNYAPYKSGLPPSVESPPVIVTVRPQAPFGLDLPTSFGDTLEISHAGSSAGTVRPIVIDPTAGTGAAYEVHFDGSVSPTRWSVLNITKGTTVLSDQTNQSGDDDYLIVDGILVKVIDNPVQPNSSSDVFSFTVPGTTQNKAAIRASIQRISVFPNPFVLERQRGPNYNSVTFTNLPPKAVIRIYNLAGQLVR